MAKAVLWQTVLEPDAAFGTYKGDDLAYRSCRGISVDRKRCFR